MVVKEKRGRRRYIAFVSDHKISHEELLSAMNPAFGERGIKPPKVIQFDGNTGIVRTSDKDKAKSVEILNSIHAQSGQPFNLNTLCTSGTLRHLRERYFNNSGATKTGERGKGGPKKGRNL